jgi:hypothetical protein
VVDKLNVGTEDFFIKGLRRVKESLEARLAKRVANSFVADEYIF